ncbi:hypothetical protein A9995_14205 [Erythrobacter sp. QSSC1-22B]|nr:hypothetical protein A9995_14205 [Erythrobacter sp. QSSC1-22B]
MTVRAPFIWSAKQAIDPMGFLAAMQDAPARAEKPNRWYLFRREFTLDQSPESAEVNITVDGRYQLFVNGKRIGRGPVRSDVHHQKYDSYDLTKHLTKGVNCIAVIVHVYGVDTAWHERVRGMWQPTFGDGGLWLDGSAQVDGGTVTVATDAEWRCIESPAWDQDTERMNKGLGFIESLDARSLPQDWNTAGFDDSEWDAVQIMHSGGGGPESFFGGLVTEPFPTLLPNPLPEMTETFVAPEQLRLVKRVRAQVELPVHRALYEEEFLDAELSITQPEAMLDQGEGHTTITTLGGEGVTLLFGFGKLFTGFPSIKIEAAGGEIIDIAVNERLPGEFTDDGMAADARVVATPVLGNDTHIARYIARPGHQTFERFEWSAIKWMQVTIRNAPAGLKVRTVGMNFMRYPAGNAGSFSCDDPFLNELWKVGQRTVQLCMHDGWEDCPSREQRQWLGDVTVEHLVSQAAFGPASHALTAKYLCDVASSQRPDGLTQMFAPGDHEVNGLLIPDWTLQWILTAADYLLWTGDEETIEDIYPAIERALQWFDLQRGPSGLVVDLPYWHFMDWSGVGRHGEACTLNAQYSGALQAAARMATALENPRAAKRLLAISAELNAALDERHWDEARGIYVDVVDPVTGKQEARTSQHANAAMILWGDAPRKRWQRMVNRITDSERLTFTAGPPIAPEGETLDEREGVVLANTFYSHFVYCALAKAGHFNRAIGLFRERLKPMLDRGADTLWESLEPTASLCHGFSASPTYQLTHEYLGLQPITNGADQLRFSPQMPDGMSAQGTLAIVNGAIEIAVKRDGYSLTGTLVVPSGTTIEADTDRFESGSSKLTFGAGKHELRLKLKPSPI